MFVKKDLRKIPDILTDPNDSREKMLLARRGPEFDGGIRILFKSYDASAFQNLQVLSLYDNMLQNIQGIGFLSYSPIIELNIGRNHLKSLPDELGQLSTLNVVWAEDNELSSFPLCLLGLTNLRRLRLSGNRIDTLPDDINRLNKLQDFALDNNKLGGLPQSIGELTLLESLVLRQNELPALPDTIGNLSNLKLLHLSSNAITAVPVSLSNLQGLEYLYINSNQLVLFPSELCILPILKSGNLSNNKIASIPTDVLQKWGPLDALSGLLKGTGSIKILLFGNPCLISPSEPEVLNAKDGRVAMMT